MEHIHCYILFVPAKVFFPPEVDPAWRDTFAIYDELEVQRSGG